MKISNQHSVETHAGRPSISTKTARVLVVLAIIASVAASFLPTFPPSQAANQQLSHHICSSCGEEIPQGANPGIQIAGGLSGGVVF